MKKVALTLALASGVFLAGCGGGGGGSDTGTDPGGNTPPPQPTVRNDVAGPLDAVQGPLSAQVLAPIASASAGTPLVGVIDCVDKIVVEDVLDIIDRLANAVQPSAGNPATALPAAAASVQAEVGDLVSDLQGYVTSLAGGGVACNGNAAPVSGSGNPLAGTPLESFAAMVLPLLSQYQTLLNGTSTVGPNSLSLTQLSTITSQITSVFTQGFALVPANVQNAPFVGSSLSLVQQSLTQLQSVLGQAAAGNGTGTELASGTALDSLLSGLFVNFVPLTQIENTSGDPGAVTAQITAAIDQIVSTFTSGLGTQSSGDLGQSLLGMFDPFVDPFQTDVLALIVGPLTSAVGGGNLPSGSLLTGTPLDSVLGVFIGVLSGGAGGDPLTSLLGSLLGGGGGSSCPLAGTPLAGLCGLLG
jgi:hypothetical protein